MSAYSGKLSKTPPEEARFSEKAVRRGEARQQLAILLMRKPVERLFEHMRNRPAVHRNTVSTWRTTGKLSDPAIAIISSAFQELIRITTQLPEPILNWLDALDEARVTGRIQHFIAEHEYVIAAAYERSARERAEQPQYYVGFSLILGMFRYWQTHQNHMYDKVSAYQAARLISRAFAVGFRHNLFGEPLEIRMRARVVGSIYNYLEPKIAENAWARRRIATLIDRFGVLEAIEYLMELVPKRRLLFI
jgi:hypothetical protein